MWFFTVAFALQFKRIERLAEDETNGTQPEKKLSRRQSFVCTVNENGNDAHGKFFQQHSDARLEILQFAIGRAFAFGKPNQVLFLFQNDGAKGQARSRSACRLDRQNFSKPAEKTQYRVGEGDTRPASPVSVAQMFPAQHCGKREWIEITNVIGREDPLSIFRQILQTLGTHSKEQAHQRLIHSIQEARDCGGNVAERLEPALLFLVENFLWVFQRIDRFALTAFGYFAQQIAHGLDA